MAHKWFLASLGGAMLVLGAGVFLSPRHSPAEPNKPSEKETSSVRVTQLPIGQVVLFNSGVGYFQREGAVEGNARVDLSFPTKDINDLLKSMVLRDLDGGHVTAVSYDSNAPLEHTLKSFAVNLTSNPSFAQILDQARGDKVEVVLQQTNATQPGMLTGTLIGCETQKQAVGKEAIEVEMLNLWCADGMHGLKLSDVQRVRFLNPVLDAEFRKALQVLAQAHDTQKKSVAINFEGEGKREVRVGYVVENPIWKTSYRLVLDKKQKPFLQGWAVVENSTDEDWKDVRVALVSGRPISFEMDLYQPRYVDRPLVEMELYASLRPVDYSGALTSSRVVRIEKLKRQGGRDAKLGRAQGKAEGKEGQGRGPAVDQQDLLLRAGVSPAASAAKLGEFFQYTIDKPVSLSRQKSALLPLFNENVEAARLSIYNEQTQAKFPLLGIRFKNTSGLHMMQGPITVFEGSNYAGDARILDLQPNEERLISYAIDLGTEVSPASGANGTRVTQVKVVKGVMHTTRKLRESKTYTIKNRNEQERLVLIEHPVRNDFKLVSTAKPAEIARDFYRFEIRVPPGKTEAQTVTEERVLEETAQMTDLDDDSIRLLIKEREISDKVKAGLRRALELREMLAKTQREIAELQRQLQSITDDQPRMRANLKELPQTSEVYQRIVKKFTEQETQIEKYQADVKKLQAIERDQKKEYEDFLVGFTIE